jgi:Ser/Thr protein kinase RdoA (MazF antagonist)
VNDIEILARLVDRRYGAINARLTPVHQFTMAGRGVYKIERAVGQPWLLRAYRREAQTDSRLAERSASLLFLEQANYPAPNLIRTLDHGLVGSDGGWAAIVVTFIEGKMAGSSLQDFYDIGTALGRLHRLAPTLGSPASLPVPPSRWQPASKIASWIDQLTAVADDVPPELQRLYDFSLATLRRVLAWPDLPATILHTDCWANNAIRTPDGQLVLVDWDGAGWGPAILDLGYLLVACHASLPEWPQIIPSAERIGAVMAGYQQQRAITPVEYDLLNDAVCFAEAFRAVQWLAEALPGNWREHRGLLRFHARYAVTTEITRLALHQLTG